MSLIPNSAISAALTPVQRAAHEQAMARQVQSRKNFHHSEEVDELEEAGVNSVRDEKQEEGHEKNPEKREREEDETEEKVEIAALGDVPQHLHLKADAAGPSLDISA